MRAFSSDPGRAMALALVLLAATAPALAAQKTSATAGKSAQATSPVQIVASEVELSRESAVLNLELKGRPDLNLSLKNGRVLVNGKDTGGYTRGDKLDKSWRDLLNTAMQTPNEQVRKLLMGWTPPAGDSSGLRLDAALESTLSGKAGTTVASAAGSAVSAGTQDTGDVRQLRSRIDELQSLVQQLENQRGRTSVRVIEHDHGSSLTSPFRSIWSGFTGIISTLALYVVLLGLGFAAIFFGRRYMEGVADTARHHTLRSWAVGVAGSFLALPVFILGIIALAVSIVGIPALLAWVPFFPVAVMLAALFGYIAVAHAMGEALAERRLQGADWFSRGNSYYYVMTGLGMLLALFLAANVVRMAGPWLGFVRGTLTFLGVVLTWAAFTIGFGAVLLSRAGTRPLTPRARDDANEPLFEEETRA